MTTSTTLLEISVTEQFHKNSLSNAFLGSETPRF